MIRNNFIANLNAQLGILLELLQPHPANVEGSKFREYFEKIVELNYILNFIFKSSK